jgi:hypothetical protein
VSHKIKTKEWSKILEFYEDLSSKHGWDIEPMISFANQVIKSPYTNSVFAYTSHATLCIGQYKELEEENALLRIEHDPVNKVAKFSYKGDKTSKYTWQKVVAETRIFAEFERFLKELKWVIASNAI